MEQSGLVTGGFGAVEVTKHIGFDEGKSTIGDALLAGAQLVEVEGKKMLEIEEREFKSFRNPPPVAQIVDFGPEADPDLKRGDWVLCHENAGTIVPIGEDEYSVLMDSDIPVLFGPDEPRGVDWVR